MAANKKPGPEAMQFIVSSLKDDKNVPYAEVREKAEKKGFTVYPIMYGRAKALLGMVKVAKRGEGRKGRAAPSSTSTGKRGRPTDSGSKSGRIRELLNAGMETSEIVKRVGASPGLVYAVRAAANKRGLGRPVTRRGPGRPRKTVGAGGSIDSVITALRDGDRERDRYRRAIEQIRSIIESVA